MSSIDKHSREQYPAKERGDGVPTKEEHPLRFESGCCICGKPVLAWAFLETYEVQLHSGEVCGVLEGWRVRCTAGCGGTVFTKSKNGSRWLEMLGLQRLQALETTCEVNDDET